MNDTLRMLEKELSNMRGQAGDFGDIVKDRLKPVDSWVRTMVEERPLAALGGAVALGYIFARLFRRR